MSDAASLSRMATGEYFDCCTKCIAVVKELNKGWYPADSFERVEDAAGQEDSTTSTTHLHTSLEDREDQAVSLEIANLLASLSPQPLPPEGA